VRKVCYLTKFLKVSFFFILLFVLTISSIGVLSFNQNNDVKSMGSVKHLEVYIVYDNYVFKGGLKPAWGISFYIIADGTVLLFDTGGDGQILVNNMRKMNLNPEDVKIVVLSHIHSDHIGGLHSLLEINNHVTIYLPSSFPKDLKDEIRSTGAKVVEVKEPMVICEGIASTGEIPSSIGLYEQSLVINTTNGVIILTGCAHPGVDNIVKRVIKTFNCSKILLVGGGFHLAGASDKRIMDIIKELEKYNVRLVMPIHCSGDRARSLFKNAYNGRCILGGVGFSFTLKDLERLAEIEPSSNLTTSITTVTITKELKMTLTYRLTLPLILLFGVTLLIIILLRRRS